jgi:hypothetical protein
MAGVLDGRPASGLPSSSVGVELANAGTQIFRSQQATVQRHTSSAAGSHQ